MATTLIKVTNHPRNRLMEAATLNSSRTGKQALSDGQPLLLTWECAHYREGNPLRKYSVGQTVRAKILSKRKTSRKHRNAATLDLSLRPSELAGNDAACSVITFETVTIEQSVIRYVQEVKDNWAWLVLSPHLKGCLFILDTSDDPSELERFLKSTSKSVTCSSCHIRSVNHERKQVDLSLHPKASDEQFKKGDLLG
ncbi:hypothetical protein SELMODRAFT_432659 [Selaginella moellendorffii]|uniref:S1 motif domain-containing protein n=1 Tax=Selaginella moellendorffii TaxID=88036 RepID=D8TGP4_SELML|nr:hypothetical protein SELMODRAFT_432659 [Selaginella moellendorffii]